MIPGIIAQGAVGTDTPTGWTPLDLGAALYAWYDADQQAEADNANISTIVDQSGNGRDFVVVSSEYAWLDHGILNGHKVIQWGTTAGGTPTHRSWYEIPVTFLQGLTEASWFAVNKAHADPAGGGQDGFVVGGMGNHGGDTHVPYSDGTAYTGFGSSSRFNWNPASLATPHIWNEESSASTPTGTGWRCYINGTSSYNSTSNTVSFRNTRRALGTGNQDGAAQYRGYTGEMVFCNQVLSTGDRQKVEGYLAWKYGLEGNLPGGHPYISGPPTV